MSIIPKGWKIKVKNNLRHHGITHFDKKIIIINKKRAKNKPNKTRPINKNAHKYPELLDTIVHELMHAKHPRMHEKTVRKNTTSKLKKMTAKTKKKMYATLTKAKILN